MEQITIIAAIIRSRISIVSGSPASTVLIATYLYYQFQTLSMTSVMAKVLQGT